MEVGQMHTQDDGAGHDETAKSSLDPRAMIRNLLKQRSVQNPNHRRPPIQHRDEWLDNYWRNNPDQPRYFAKPLASPPSHRLPVDANEQTITVPRDLEVGSALRCGQAHSRNILLQAGVHTPSPHPSMRSLTADGSSCTRSTTLEALAVRGTLSVSASGRGRGNSGGDHATVLSDWLLAEESRGLLRDLALVWRGRSGRSGKGSGDRAGEDRGGSDVLAERLLGSAADWQAELCVLMRVYGGPWELEDCVMSCGGVGPAGPKGCVLLCSREAKSSLVRCKLQGTEEDDRPDLSAAGSGDGPRDCGGHGALGYGVVSLGRSLTELRSCSIVGASEAAVLVSGRAAALFSRGRLLDNAFGVWVCEHGYVRVRGW